MIPKCKTWIVRRYLNGKLVSTCETYGPTKLLAQLNHRHDHPLHGVQVIDKVTYSVKRTKDYCHSKELN